MPLFRCLLETVVLVEASTEKEAEIKGMEEINEQFKSGRGSIICWEVDDSEAR